MRISASIYANRESNLEELIKAFEDHSVDMFHIDCNDDESVFEDIRAIKKISSRPIDLHIISPNPSKFNKQIEDTKPEYVTYQYEVLEEKLSIPKVQNVKFGLAIESQTKISIFDEYSKQMDFILFMATIPGQSGGFFQNNNFKKIRKFQAQYPEKNIHVDGGVNGEVSFILRNLGVDIAVSGSYLFKESELGIAMLNLKVNEIDSKYKVKDFMREVDEIPSLKETDASFKEILQSIEDYKLGFTLITDQDSKLKGIITNADVRKGLLKNTSDLNQVVLEDLVNRNPVVANEEFTVIDLLRIVKKQKFPISYLPVTNHNGELTGAITFVNLVKGEL